MNLRGAVAGLLLLFLFDNLGTVTGTVLDRQHRPMADALVVCTSQDTGKALKGTTDRDGHFSFSGLPYATYEVEVFNAHGRREFSGRFLVRWQTRSYNLSIDLSTILPNGEMFPGEDSNMAVEGKVSRERLAEIRAINARNDRTNELIAEYNKTLDAQDWRHAQEILRELIGLDASRWEYYQNMGVLQTSLGHPAEAATAFRRAAVLLQQGMTALPDKAAAKKELSRMLIYEGDAYNLAGEVAKADAAYNRAAAMGIEPGLAYLHECNVESHIGTMEAAIEACNRAIAVDPGRWEYYCLLANIENRMDKSQEAIQAYDQSIALLKKNLPAEKNQEKAKAALGQMLTSEGHLYAQQSKFDQAIPLFTEAANFAVYPAMPYFDLCASLFNVSRTTEAASACDKAIASDPKMADAWYVKGLALFGQAATSDGHLVAPPGTTEAFRKYLELAPTGNHVESVREMLKKLGSKG